MVNIPLLSRLSPGEYSAIFFGFLFLGVEIFIRLVITLILPKPVVNWFYNRSRHLFNYFGSQRPSHGDKAQVKLIDNVRRAQDFGELCSVWGYKFEEHVVLTKDGYLLGIHRLCTPKSARRNSIGVPSSKPVVYLHHGLLMNSEVWICLTSADRSLAFALVEMGFDVWLGNNRGNKYSKKSIHHDPKSKEFWNYSIDDFAWHDIPDCIEYILRFTEASKVSYVGFSQGTAQAFAALSIHPQLNQKINVFIALAPAIKPAGLAAPIVDGLMKTSPSLMYLAFGRNAILSSVPFWANLLYPPLFSSIIDAALFWLFNWKSRNISEAQKHAAYSHLYSFASTKSVVHWFQIMRNGQFTMYDDDADGFSAPSARNAPSGPTAYHPVRFPTKNISSPIVLIYGEEDNLVDIDSMLRELPEARTSVKPLRGYEHLDILWGKDVHKDVFPTVVETLKHYARKTEKNGDGTSTMHLVE